MRLAGHQNEVTARKGNVCCEKSPLVADLFLFHLDQDFLPHFNDILDSYLLAGLLAIVFRMDFMKREEAVALRSIVHECSLKAGLHVCDDAFVKIAHNLAPCSRLNEEAFKCLPLHHGYTEFLRVGGIDDQCLACHFVALPFSPAVRDSRCCFA